MKANKTHAANLNDSLESSGEMEAEAHWGIWLKVAFRFGFSYLFLYLFPFTFRVGGLWGPTLVQTADNPRYKIAHWVAAEMLHLVEMYASLWHKIIPRVGEHVLHLRYPITIFPEEAGGSDTTYENVEVFCFVLIAALASAVWSVTDRKRTEYSRLNQWLQLYVRMVVVCTMFVFGAGKVVPVQMPPPSLSTLMQPFGDMTPYRLGWSFIGASSGYQIFAGAVEVLGGVLLLIPGMTTLGAFVTLGAMTNVFMIDACYGIPVKFWALHLILLSLFLLLPDIRRLTNLLVLNRGTEPQRRRPFFRRRGLNYSVWGIQWAVGIYFLVITLFGSSLSLREIHNIPLTNPLYGIWSVTEFAEDGEVRPPLLTDDQRWQRAIFTSKSALTIQDMSGQFSRYAVMINAKENTLSLKRVRDSGASSPWWSELYPPPVIAAPSLRWRNSTELNYQRPQPEEMILDGLMNGHRLRVTLRKEERQFILKTREFRWINDEHDFYNEFFVE